METPAPKRVQKLSNAQIRKTMSGSAKDNTGRPKKKVVRAALRNPHAYVCAPAVDEDVQGEVLKALAQIVKDTHRPRPSSQPLYRQKVSERRKQFLDEMRKIIAVRPKLPKAEREAEIDAARAAMTASLAASLAKLTPRAPADQAELPEKRLVVGVNEVLKCAERGRLAAVLTDSERTVGLLTNALLPLCVAKKLPGMAVRGLNDAVAPMLALKSVTCVGVLPTKDPGTPCALVDLLSEHGKITL